MVGASGGGFISAVFITFSGNCKKALTYYQTCFGGALQFDMFEEPLPGYPEVPVVSGSLVSERIVIYGSDLVPSGGRTLGNHMSIFLHCENTAVRQALIVKLLHNSKYPFATPNQKLVDIMDVFEVQWILGV